MCMSRIEEWLVNVQHTSMSFEFLSVVLWHIWKERNNFAVERKPQTLESYWNQPQPGMKALFARQQDPKKNRPLIKIRPSLETAKKGGFLKLNVDGTYMEGTIEGAIMSVRRDSSGLLMDCFARTL